jgi:CDP-glucose 4,6-dehydratase
MTERGFWHGRRVWLTGHTGFKGAWLALWLQRLGAEVHGFSAGPVSEPSFYEAARVGDGMAGDVRGDVRSKGELRAAVARARPEVAIHMAAQALVRRGIEQPVETFSVNVVGTAKVLEALRAEADPAAVVVVTSDKCYRQPGPGRPFREDDPLGGADPYSASKAAQEHVAASYRALGLPLATVRAGNVIGGGDWSEDRLIPDVWRAVRSGEPLRLRNPQATRPWQHVLEPLSGYLGYIERLASGADVPASLNFGPPPGDILTVSEVANAMFAAMHSTPRWVEPQGPQPDEAQFLAIDPALAMRSIGWRPRLAPSQALQWTAEWYRAVLSGTEPRQAALDQIRNYELLA